MRAADERRNASIITSISIRCWSTGFDVGCTMKTSAPRMFSSIWNDTSLSGKRRSRAWPKGSPSISAISFDSCGWALPEKIFSSPYPVATSPSPLSGRFITGSRLENRIASLLFTQALTGWGGRIRTSEYGIQRPAPYHLATPQFDIVPVTRDPLLGEPDQRRVAALGTVWQG